MGQQSECSVAGSSDSGTLTSCIPGVNRAGHIKACLVQEYLLPTSLAYLLMGFGSS